MTAQLRCGGVLEAVRVSRAGFPHRMLHRDFFDRYHMLQFLISGAANRPPADVSVTGAEPTAVEAAEETSQATRLRKQVSQGKQHRTSSAREVFKRLRWKSSSTKKPNQPQPNRVQRAVVRENHQSLTSDRERNVALVSSLRSALASLICSGGPGTSSSASAGARLEGVDGNGQTTTPPSNTAQSTEIGSQPKASLEEQFAALGTQVGKTKVFLRAKTFGVLESLRSSIQR